MSEPVKLFIAPRFREDKEDIRLIRTFNADPSNELLFKKLPKDYRFTGFAFVPSIEDADFVLIPQSLRKDTPKWRAYFNVQKLHANRYGKKILLFIGTDLSHRMHVDGAIVFKGSAYKSDLRTNEIVSVPFSEDLSETVPFTPRTKGEKPVVSFCGYAGFPDLKTRLTYEIKNFALDVASYATLNPQLRVFKRGIYFRRTAIAQLRASSRISTNFIIRDSFAGNVGTTRVDPQQARKEYLENMTNADFILCPKGDGNYSVRFYETLSLGRIPLLIDTDMVLPLENQLDYSKFILRVSHADMKRLPDIVADFYGSLSNDEFAAMQESARHAFKNFLRYDAFFNTTFSLLKEKKIIAF